MLSLRTQRASGGPLVGKGVRAGAGQGAQHGAQHKHRGGSACSHAWTDSSTLGAFHPFRMRRRTAFEPWDLQDTLLQAHPIATQQQEEGRREARPSGRSSSSSSMDMRSTTTCLRNPLQPLLFS